MTREETIAAKTCAKDLDTWCKEKRAATRDAVNDHLDAIHDLIADELLNAPRTHIGEVYANTGKLLIIDPLALLHPAWLATVR